MTPLATQDPNDPLYALCLTVRTTESLSVQENDQEQASAVGIDPEVQWRHLVAGCIDKLEEQRQRRLTKKHSNGQTYSSTSSPGSAGRRTQKQARAAEDANGAVSPLSAPTSVDCDSSPSTPNRATSEWNALHVSKCSHDWCISTWYIYSYVHVNTLVCRHI